jgi:hypothetical protein
MFVMLLATTKTNSEKQALVAGTKLSRMAGWLTRQLGQLALFCAGNLLPCFVEVDVLKTDMF